MSVVNKVVVKNVAYDIEDAKTKQALSKEVTRAQAKEKELEEELKDVQDKLNTTESVTEVSWGASSNMNSFTTAGVYNIKGERTNANDNLPITNIGENATIAARLIVTVTPEGATTYRHSVGQTLILSNAEGKETKVYTRNGNRTSSDGGVTYIVTWGEWANLQTNVNVGQVTSLDSFIDNGIYSGVWVKNAARVETFVMIVINNYAAATQAGVPKSITQFKYSVAVGGSMPIYETRVGISENDWNSWEEIASKDIISQMISNEISKVIDSAPDAFDTLKEVADWILNDQSGAAAMATQINANANNLAETKKNIANQLFATPDADKVTLTGRNEQSMRLNFSADISAATTESAGVMSANDKQKLEASAESFEFYTEKEKVGLEISANSGNLSEVYIPAATPENAGVMSAEDKVALNTATSRALRALFIAAGAEYNDTGTNKTKTAPWGETVTHKAGRYYLNGLGDITEEQMINIYNAGALGVSESMQGFLGNLKVRTNLPPQGINVRRFKTFDFTNSFISEELEIVALSDGRYDEEYPVMLKSVNGFLGTANRVKRVLGVIDVKSVTSGWNAIFGISLEHIKIKNMVSSLRFPDSKLLSKESVMYMIQNATPTSAITVTLHADAYARLAEDADIVAALEAQPLVTLVSL